MYELNRLCNSVNNRGTSASNHGAVYWFILRLHGGPDAKIFCVLLSIRFVQVYRYTQELDRFKEVQTQVQQTATERDVGFHIFLITALI
jgi:hypothetical protein